MERNDRYRDVEVHLMVYLYKISMYIVSYWEDSEFASIFQQISSATSSRIMAQIDGWRHSRRCVSPHLRAPANFWSWGASNMATVSMRCMRGVAVDGGGRFSANCGDAQHHAVIIHPVDVTCHRIGTQHCSWPAGPWWQQQSLAATDNMAKTHAVIIKATTSTMAVLMARRDGVHAPLERAHTSSGWQFHFFHMSSGRHKKYREYTCTSGVSWWSHAHRKHVCAPSL